MLKAAIVRLELNIETTIKLHQVVIKEIDCEVCNLHVVTQDAENLSLAGAK